MAADDAKDGGESEAAAGELGGEEGVEDAGDGFGAHAGAVVGDLEIDVVAGGKFGGEVGGAEEGGVGVLKAGGDVDVARAVADGVGGVDDEVHQDLLHLGGVGADGGKRFREAEAEAGFFADGELEEGGGVFDQGAKVDAFEDEAALAGVGEHLFAEVGGAEGGGFGLVELAVGVGALFEGHAGEGEVAEDAGEEVVEVVGDAAGEDAEAFEFLGFLEAAFKFATFLFSALALGGVLDDGDEDGRGFGAGEEEADFDGVGGAVLAAVSAFEGDEGFGAGAEGGGELLEGGG